MFHRSIVTLFVVAGLGLGCAHGAAAPEKKESYAIRGQEIEACECESVCPCVWAKDNTFGDCRAVMVWQVESGSYGTTDLQGIAFAVALTKSGKNVVQAMGKWEGTIYVSDKASAEQKNAVVTILSGKWGKAFAKVDVRSAPMELKADGERREARIGKVATLKMSGLPGSGGKVPSIENPPFALIPKLYCAKAETHLFDDGSAKWDFSGRNAFYGPFEYRSE
jgi:hypothetical protein